MENVDKRRVIMRAAVTTFAKRGYHGTRVSDVAKEAGVAYGLVYHYFENKEQLLHSIFEENWELFVRVLKQISLEGERTFAERIEGLIGFLLDLFDNNPELLKVLIVEVTRSSRFLEEESLEKFRAAFEIVTKMIRKAQKQGQAAKQIDAQVAAYLLLGSIDTVLSARVVGVPQFGLKATKQLRKTIVNYVLLGMQPARP